MNKKIVFKETYAELLLNKVYLGEFPSNSIFNFMNSHSVYLFRKHSTFREHILRQNNFNFIDGFMISFFLSLRYMKMVKRLKGPDFSDFFLKNSKLTKNKKHLFVGISDVDLKKVLAKYPLIEKKNAFSYDVPLLKKEKFDDSKLVKIIKKIKPDYVWVAIGNPKQEILSNDLAEKITVPFFFNVGAFFDYAMDKKKQSPKLFQFLGLEWIYRLIADFKHTWKKVKRSFIANFYILRSIKLK
jgi:N-acetylglucosaminyldiphosphoundecaprenol N-acetyl-beta-D-mannosaminyltransferase